jgi:hypothetical protein
MTPSLVGINSRQLITTNLKEVIDYLKNISSSAKRIRKEERKNNNTAFSDMKTIKIL